MILILQKTNFTPPPLDFFESPLPKTTYKIKMALICKTSSAPIKDYKTLSIDCRRVVNLTTYNCLLTNLRRWARQTTKEAVYIYIMARR